MSALIKFLSVVFEVVRQVMDYLNTKKLIDAGKKEQIADELLEKDQRNKQADSLVDGPIDRSWLRQKRDKGGK